MRSRKVKLHGSLRALRYESFFQFFRGISSPSYHNTHLFTRSVLQSLIEARNLTYSGVTKRAVSSKHGHRCLKQKLKRFTRAAIIPPHQFYNILPEAIRIRRICKSRSNRARYYHIIRRENTMKAKGIYHIKYDILMNRRDGEQSGGVINKGCNCRSIVLHSNPPLILHKT